MGILQDNTKIGVNISSDISVDLFLSSVNANFLTGKAIEHLVEKGCNPDLKEHESILNAIYYLVGELEENHSHELSEWRESPILHYVSNLLQAKEAE